MHDECPQFQTFRGPRSSCVARERLRAVLRQRWGGKEPLLTPRLAAELSVWYDLDYRPDHGAYGFGGDRELNSTSHRFLGSALVVYTMQPAVSLKSRSMAVPQVCSYRDGRPRILSAAMRPWRFAGPASGINAH